MLAVNRLDQLVIDICSSVPFRLSICNSVYLCSYVVITKTAFLCESLDLMQD